MSLVSHPNKNCYCLKTITLFIWILLNLDFLFFLLYQNFLDQDKKKFEDYTWVETQVKSALGHINVTLGSHNEFGEYLGSLCFFEAGYGEMALILFYINTSCAHLFFVRHAHDNQNTDAQNWLSITLVFCCNNCLDLSSEKFF